MPMRVLFSTCVAAVVFSLPGCAYKAAVPPSRGHIDASQIPPNPQEKILPPVTRSVFVPPPRPQVKVPTYSVVVNEVPVRELLFALSRDTKQNIDVHPNIQGLVTLNAIDETLPAILERISQQVNLRYRSQGKTIIVVPDTPYFKNYRVNYVNMNRDSSSSIGVSGEISGASVGGGAGGQSGGQGGGANASTSKVDTKSTNNFWEVLRQNIESILSASKAINQNADQRAARAEAQKAANEARIAQAEAVSRAGANAQQLFNTAFPEAANAPSDAKNEIVVNPITGTITILGTEKQQALIQQYLDSVGSASQRQVLIEATIAEVRLSNNYQAGVDWSRIATGTGFTFNQLLLGAPPTGAPPGLTIGYTNATSDVGSINVSLRLLEQFGNTRVLSSPKLMALNNQMALMKVVDNIVYFTIEADTNTNQTTAVTTFTSSAKTVPVGLIMSVLPQITETGSVNLTVRPTISRVTRFVSDPNPSLRAGTGTPIPNLIPEIQIREMESVLQVGSGQTIILGGLMQDDVRRDRDQIPGLGNIPRVGEAFQYRNEAVSKTELIIFLKPTVITNPSLDSDELKMFQRFLPVMDKTGKTP